MKEEMGGKKGEQKGEQKGEKKGEMKGIRKGYSNEKRRCATKGKTNLFVFYISSLIRKLFETLICCTKLNNHLDLSTN